jgi:hypothetical protein
VMGQSCCGPCVVLKDEAVATSWGAYEGTVAPGLDPEAATVDGSHFADQQGSKRSPLTGNAFQKTMTTLHR